MTDYTPPPKPPKPPEARELISERWNLSGTGVQKLIGTQNASEILRNHTPERENHQKVLTPIGDSGSILSQTGAAGDDPRPERPMLNSPFDTTEISRSYSNDIYGRRDESKLYISVRASFKEEIKRARRHISRALRNGAKSGRYRAFRGKMYENNHGTWRDYTMTFTVVYN